MSVYKTISDVEKMVGPKLKKRSIQIGKTNNKKINLKNIKQLVQAISKKYEVSRKKKPSKTLVRGLNILGEFTHSLLATDENIDDMFETIDDYLNGRVLTTTKFQDVYQVQIVFYE
jgi:hypothetical protein